MKIRYAEYDELVTIGIDTLRKMRSGKMSAEEGVAHATVVKATVDALRSEMLHAKFAEAMRTVNAPKALGAPQADSKAKQRAQLPPRRIRAA